MRQRQQAEDIALNFSSAGRFVAVFDGHCSAAALCLNGEDKNVGESFSCYRHVVESGCTRAAEVEVRDVREEDLPVVLRGGLAPKQLWASWLRRCSHDGSCWLCSQFGGKMLSGGGHLCGSNGLSSIFRCG